MRFLGTSLLLLVLLAWPLSSLAQDAPSDVQIVPDDVDITDPSLVTPPTEDFYRGEVLEIVEERREDLGLSGTRPYFQKVRVVFRNGELEGEEVVIEYGSLSEEQKLREGQSVVLVVPENVGAFIFDRYRLPALGAIAALFVVLAVMFAGWRGLTSLAGLAVSVLVLIFYVVPQIMDGKNPLVTSLVAAFIIATVSIYLAHGFKRRTSVAVVSTLITAAIAVGLSQLFVSWTGLLGVGSEEAFYLQTSSASFINLRGLLLGGIIIGALGVLDDITTSQAAAVEEIWRANPSLSKRELYKRGASVGKEHITSLVNTLALAYVGASFPALLLFTVYQRPWWVVANSEAIAEEIIRTLVGSIALMIAVPITTFIAAYWLPSGTMPPRDDAPSHTH